MVLVVPVVPSADCGNSESDRDVAVLIEPLQPVAAGGSRQPREIFDVDVGQLSPVGGAACKAAVRDLPAA
ncbi:hypothetical protein BBK14_23000 [Parafrankia soli]|uniref:Uncharacterized protein n=1 Tax=Parafrankia soli TaxID=2599596 RepID=A0A1S1PTC0_9ACTN|nr:hypothetical protein BBK14_23000 [Parafrankia soli]